MMIHDHQIEHLEKVKLHKGIGFFIIRFHIITKLFSRCSIAYQRISSDDKKLYSI